MVVVKIFGTKLIDWGWMRKSRRSEEQGVLPKLQRQKCELSFFASLSLYWNCELDGIRSKQFGGIQFVKARLHLPRLFFLWLLAACQPAAQQSFDRYVVEGYEVSECLPRTSLKGFSRNKDLSVYPFPKEVSTSKIFLGPANSSFAVFLSDGAISERAKSICVRKFSSVQQLKASFKGKNGSQSWEKVASLQERERFDAIIRKCKKIPKNKVIWHYFGSYYNRFDVEVPSSPQPSDFIGCDRIARGHVIQFWTGTNFSTRISAVGSSFFIDGVKAE